MTKKLKITFGRGGVVYARLLTEEAPKTVELICSELPCTVKMMHGRSAGAAMFYETALTDVERENADDKNKEPGMLTLTLGAPYSYHPKKAVHICYPGKIFNSNVENHFAQIEEKYMDDIKTIGERVWLDGPEMTTLELVETES